jgi:hypothetical protein
MGLSGGAIAVLRGKLPHCHYSPFVRIPRRLGKVVGHAWWKGTVVDTDRALG